MIQIRYELKYPGTGGIVMQAVSLTAGVLCVMMFVYATRLIRVTDKLRMADRSRRRRGRTVLRGVHGPSPFRLWHPRGVRGEPADRNRLQPVRGRPRGVQPVAGLRLHREGRGHEAPKYMEWYGAFGLMVTLIWLYIEILRLLMKLADRR